jgi:hypothetical protein
MKSKWVIAVAIVITITVIVIVAFMMNRDSQSAEYQIEDGRLAISCSFGVSVPLDEIDGLTLTETAPEIETKTNGAGIGSMHKGEYRLSDGTSARLYIDTSVPLFVRFSQGGTVYYLNAENAEATQALYAELSAAIE